MAVTIRLGKAGTGAPVRVYPNRAAEPRPGGRLTWTERRDLRRAGREQAGMIRRLLARGVPAAAIAEAVR